MKAPGLIAILFLFMHFRAASQRYLDSLHDALRLASTDSARFILLCEIAENHNYAQTDSNALYVDRATALAKKMNFKYGLWRAKRSRFWFYNFRAEYIKALLEAQECLEIAHTIPVGNHMYEQVSIVDIAQVKREMFDSVGYAQEWEKANALQKQYGLTDNEAWWGNSYKGLALIKKGQHESGIALLKKSYDKAGSRSDHYHSFMGMASAMLAEGYSLMGEDSLARLYFHVGLEQCDYFNNLYIRARIFMNLAQFYAHKRPDSSIYFGRLCIEICKANNFGDYATTAADTLAKIFRAKKMPDSALRYLQVRLDAKDTIFSPARMQQFHSLLAEQEKIQREAEQANEIYQARVKLYATIAGLLVLLTISLILYRNNRQKQKAFSLLQRQKQEIDTQRNKAEKALGELKSTQAQLIQSEKMASLGELTAGIAHEIQNPLNFVNNFSDLNSELIDEMNAKLDQGDIGDAKAMAANIKENLDKINHHGKRAEGIVKGMLQHSRETKGQKEPTDINTLVDEYLRLSFQGLRAKDKSFNARLQTNFDQSIGMVNTIPQDIGRVLLNLYNNAFYAVSEKKKRQPDGYEPTVSVSTSKADGKIEIRVRDNGNGIPEKVSEKIFQPFFTTKPTGQGTGLGLSLSYDIIKAHGGEIKVETKEGEGAEFIIQLPIPV